MLELAAASHDDGVRELSVLSARLAYALMCMTLTWGVLVSTGWFDRLTGRHALRGTHQVFATLTLAFAFVHGVSFTLLDQARSVADLIIPFRGVLRDTFGVLAFEGMLTAAIAVGLKRWTSYWRWLWLHRLAYPAFVLGVLHAFFQALAKGTLSTVYLGGLTLLVPALTVILLRLVPAKTLEAAGLAEDGP
ncbi:ferric reductase-like transmembrane domain-containing protein [Actinophytocola algeriensis]|uniref:Sulfoxide reductase heme-binding subunit YedZ n=1 Tax=Actinophytocola algeriensis TaxID=1768010 RepID=A0A7W7VGT0_9PSEU|nr:ferric reductase-like transmembrane domain-containing protein [Actinophytocola algeriensis]MBB4909673.1 sulfoxide reductase heme-binding subunit YedZ [Actinophytocola algeriensis]MBE1475663.1 sulfoxide reductase heme-binding subunit YedZ [Actinophytocola algeriensis]